MIESHSEFPARERRLAGVWSKSREVAAFLLVRAKELARTLPGNQVAELTGSVGSFVRSVGKEAQLDEDFGRFCRWVRAGVGDGFLLSRFALHLVVVLLAVGMVAVGRVSLPQVDFLVPTPTAAPDLGAHTITTAPSNRGGNRFAVNSSTLFQAPVPHTTVSERDRMAIITYTVQPNDNVWSIAQGFGLQVETVMWANPAVEQAPDHLSVGQSLTILPLDGMYYTIQAGDTIDGIAKKYQTTAEKIITFELNGLEEPYTLVPGQRLVLPGGRKKVVPVQNYYPMTRVGSPPPGAAAGSGRFAWPTRGLLSQRYWSAHPAIDIANSRGTPIVAADAGYVQMAGRDTWGYGNQVLINHGNGYVTRYAHLDTIQVKAGQSVKKNQQIGTMGSTGRSTGPHLHFEIIKDGQRLNPQAFLP